MARRKQRGGAYRPRGLVNRGSGRIDPSTGNLRLPVDDVPAILGRNEYVVNAGAVRKVGTKFLDQLNNTGLGTSTLPRNTGMYGNYQKGGRVRKQRGGGTGNPIVRSSMHARQGEFIFQQSGQPYTGPYHTHQDGTNMIGAGTKGATHSINPDEVIVGSYGGGTPYEPDRKRYHKRKRRIRDPYQGKGGSTGPNMGRARPVRDRAYKRKRNRRRPMIAKQMGGGARTMGGVRPQMGMAGTIDQETMTEITDCLGGCGSTFEDGHVEYGKDCMKNCTDKILW